MTFLSFAITFELRDWNLQNLKEPHATKKIEFISMKAKIHEIWQKWMKLSFYLEISLSCPNFVSFCLVHEWNLLLCMDITVTNALVKQGLLGRLMEGNNVNVPCSTY